MMRWLPCVLLLLPGSTALAGSCGTPAITNLVFGTYTGASALSTTATVTVNCTSGFAYVLGLNGGDSGVTTGRQMASSGATKLNYGMYQNAAHTTNWGDNNGVDTVSATGTGANQTFTVYGLLPAGQNEAPGTYLDYPIIYVQNGNYSTFNPMATVSPSCTISASSLSFGTYTGSIVYGNSTLNANCTDTTPYNVGLSAGTSTAATVTARAMTGPSSSTLAYSLFQSNSYTANWGMTVGTDTVAGTGTGTTQALTVYGRISAGLYVTPGTYSDTITVTVTY